MFYDIVIDLALPSLPDTYPKVELLTLYEDFPIVWAGLCMAHRMPVSRTLCSKYVSWGATATSKSASEEEEHSGFFGSWKKSAPVQLSGRSTVGYIWVWVNISYWMVLDGSRQDNVYN